MTARLNPFFLQIVFLFLLLNSSFIKAQTNFLSQIGKVDSLYSKNLKEQRKIWVELPTNFNKNNKYPVVYIIDGSTHLPTVAALQNYYSGGFFPEMILVGISNQQNRTRDLTISKITNRQGGTYRQETGGADKFTEFIEKELIPYIEKKYPTTSYRTLIGHSFGGLFAINTLVHHPHLFTNYLAVDPSLDWDNQRLIKEAEEVLKNKNLNNKALFISLGGQLHMQRNDITLENIMNDKSDFTLFGRSNLTFTELAKRHQKNGLKTTWKFYEKDFHGTISFPSIRDGMISFFDWYEIKNTHKFNDPNTSTSELLKIIKNQEERYEKHFGYFTPPFDEGLLNMSGYMFLEIGQTEKSLAFFELAVKYYPQSANACDSLAEFHASQKEYSKALENANKAYNLSNSPIHSKKITDYKALLQKGEK